MHNIITKITDWGIFEPKIEAMVLVGSYARGNYKADSDIDICILTKYKEIMVSDTSFIEQFGTVLNYRKEYWGACTSIRVWYDNGVEIEFGVVEPEWANLPLDEGTRKVLEDGYQVLFDKKGHFTKDGFHVKPLLGEYLDHSTFLHYHYTVDELEDFCKRVGMSITTDTKILEAQIREYLSN